MYIVKIIKKQLYIHGLDLYIMYISLGSCRYRKPLKFLIEKLAISWSNLIARHILVTLTDIPNTPQAYLTLSLRTLFRYTRINNEIIETSEPSIQVKHFQRDQDKSCLTLNQIYNM